MSVQGSRPRRKGPRLTAPVALAALGSLVFLAACTAPVTGPTGEGPSGAASSKAAPGAASVPASAAASQGAQTFDGQGEAGADGGGEPQPPGPPGARVDVPYQSKIDVKPADGWAFKDCAAVRKQLGTQLAKVRTEVLRLTACTAAGFTLNSEHYSSDLEPFTLVVDAASGPVDVTWQFRVALASPEPPAAPKEAEYPFPFTAGTVARIPFSDLGITCTECADGMRVRVDGVEPAGAGAEASSTHLLVSPSSPSAQRVVVSYSLGDDSGQFAESITLAVNFAAPAKRPIASGDIVLPLAGDAAVSVNVADYLAPIDGRKWSVASCGDPSRGTVTCARSGKLRYVPHKGAHLGGGGDRVIDQFSYTVRTEDGALDTASVTLVPADSPLLSSGLRSDGVPLGTEARTGFVPSKPDPPQQPATNRFLGIQDLLKGVGA